jgi:hypothetical protein
VVYYFQNIDEKFSNTIVDTSVYYFNATGPDIGIELSKEIGLPGPYSVSAPGFEVLAFLVSLVAVILIFKYSKKHRRK